MVNGEMSLRRLKLSIDEVLTPREEEYVNYGLDDPGFESRRGQKCEKVKTDSGSPQSLLFGGNLVLFLEVKQL
jgi:hypothetical protein